MQSDFAERLRLTLERHPDAMPRNLELEILETVALADMEKAVQVLTHCRQFGVRFALDDFGTGYSSLTYFRSLPVDILKVDQSFVREMLDDPDDLGIVESVVKLAHAFNRQVIAEGVETLEHGAMLIHLGCPLVQGYGIARPMPAEKLPAWIGQWHKNAAWLTLDKRLPAREDLTLLVAAQSHRNWIDKIVEHLEHPEAEVSASMDSLHCRFGRWYRGSGTVRYGEFREFQAIDSQHERVHVLAAEMVNMAESGDTEIARRQIPELYQTRDALLKLIDALIEKVASSST